MVIVMIGFSGCTREIPKIQEVKIKPSQICQDHEKILSYAYNYVVKEFREAYISKNDYNGAKAQLFLIENNSQTSFAKNINAAQSAYEKEYELAKKDKCDLKDFKNSPIIYIKQRVELLKTK